MKTCPNCNASLPDVAKFCNKCGFNIKKYEEENSQKDIFCMECGAKMSADSMFCMECGTSINGKDAIGSFDFSCIEKEAKNQLAIQCGLEIENGVLVKYTGKSRSVEIPSGVVEIFDGAFENNTVVSSVTIPEGVKIIGKRAFYGCRYLKTVTIPSTVEEIYNEAFSDCKELERAILPEKITIIREGVFSGCEALKEIKIPRGVTKIERYGLSCKAEKIHISNLEKWLKIQCDGSGAKPEGDLYVNGKLLTEVTIPSTVTCIRINAFSGCKHLKSVLLHDGITVIHKAAFCGCSSLKAVSVPKSVIKIEESAFYNCENLSNVTLREGLTDIGDYAFHICKNLKSIRLPKSLACVGFSAFDNYLKTVYVPRAKKEYYERVLSVSKEKIIGY